MVKLIRVLMLGPVVLALSVLESRLRDGQGVSAPPGSAVGHPARARPSVHRLVPWFIVGFLATALLRSLGALPETVLPPMAEAASALTVLAMAALGLGVDVRAVAQAGARATATVVTSLLILGGLSLGLIHLLR